MALEAVTGLELLGGLRLPLLLRCYPWRFCRSTSAWPESSWLRRYGWKGHDFTGCYKWQRNRHSDSRKDRISWDQGMCSIRMLHALSFKGTYLTILRDSEIYFQMDQAFLPKLVSGFHREQGIVLPSFFQKISPNKLKPSLPLGCPQVFAEVHRSDCRV